MQLPFAKRSGTDPDALAYFGRAEIASGTQTPTAYDNAASFTAASSQSLTSTASNLQCQNQSFTVAGWFFMPANAPAYISLITQGAHPINAGGGFTLQRFDSFNLVYLTIRNDNTSSSVGVNSASFVPNTWNFVECGWDSTLNQSFISLNGGTRNFSTAVAGWTFPNTTNATRLGRSPFGDFLTGNLAGWGLWKKALTASEVTQLWNNGAGRTYASLDSGLLTNLISWWALNQNSVTADSHTGGNTLSNTTSVSANVLGPIVTTTQNSRQLINNFVKGIKSLGLWNSMVCWPLRSSQNAGTGTTAYSLGGLGTFNGDLVNGPSWGSSGVNFNKTATQFIGTSLNPNLTNNGIFVCSDWSQISASEIQITAIGNRDIYGANGRGASLGMTNTSSLRAISSPGGTTINSFQITPLPTGFGCHSMLSNGSVLTVNQNNTQVATQTIVSGTTAVSLNIGSALYSQYTYKGVIPFAAAFYAPVSNTAIYNLYKSTLGLGLNLP